MAAQRSLHLLLEKLRILGHHGLGFLKRLSDRIVTASPRVVERGLVGAEVDVDVVLGGIFPEVHYIALVGIAAGFLLGEARVDVLEQFLNVVIHLIDPTLLITLLRSGRVDFGGDAHHTGDVAGLGLGAAHATEASSDKQLASSAAAVFTRCVEHGDSGAVDDALRADIHIGASGHLAVLRHAEGVVTLPVVGFAVVRDHHAVGDHHARGVLMRGEEAHRVTAVHSQGLVFVHVGKVLHYEAVLCPVLEDGTVAAVDDELVGMLCHGRVEVVLDHQHDGRGLLAFGRIFLNRAGVHLVGRTETVHVDAAVFLQLLGKFGGQGGVELGGEVTQGVADGQLLLSLRQDVLALGRVVDIRVIRFHFRQFIGDAGENLFLEIVQSVHFMVIICVIS